jgi:hypothetical protein
LGESTVISGSVTDISTFSQQYPEEQSPLVANVPVVLSYVKDGVWTDFATVNTASDGTYMYSWTPPSEGAYKVVARFEGTDAYYWSSAQQVVQVNPAASTPAASATPAANSSSQENSNTALYISGTAAVIVAIIAATVVILRKRK